MKTKKTDEVTESSDIRYYKEKVWNRTTRPQLLYNAYGELVRIEPKSFAIVDRGEKMGTARISAKEA